MKKMMIGAVAMMLALSVKAAAVTWYGALSDMSDYSYLVDDKGVLTTSLPDGGAIVLALLTEGSDFSASGTWSVAKELDTALIGDDSSVSGYYTFNYASTIIADDDVLAVVYKDANGYSMLEYAAGGKVTDTLTVAGLSSAENLWDQEFTFAGGGNFMAVPEPTSGLLLLLGMAGLMLKRKRA